MKMYEVEVSANKDGEILIIQPSYCDGDQTIIVAPDQIETLIGWLKAMRDVVLSSELHQQEKPVEKQVSTND